MMEEKNTTENLIDKTQDLIAEYRSLIALRLVEHTSEGVSIYAAAILWLVVGSFVLLFAGIGASIWLGEYLDNLKAGFFIVGGFFTVLLVILILTTKKLWLPMLRDLVIRKMYEHD